MWQVIAALTGIWYGIGLIAGLGLVLLVLTERLRRLHPRFCVITTVRGAGLDESSLKTFFTSRQARMWRAKQLRLMVGLNPDWASEVVPDNQVHLRFIHNQSVDVVLRLAKAKSVFLPNR